MLPPAPTVLTQDDACFVRVKPQADLSHPLGDGSEHLLSLLLAHTVHDSIVGVVSAFK